MYLINLNLPAYTFKLNTHLYFSLQFILEFVLSMKKYSQYRQEGLGRGTVSVLTAPALLLLLLKEIVNARLGESDQHPISPKTPTPQHQP